MHKTTIPHKIWSRSAIELVFYSRDGIIYHVDGQAAAQRPSLEDEVGWKLADKIAEVTISISTTDCHATLDKTYNMVVSQEYC
jgi:hypothetical protein